MALISTSGKVRQAAHPAGVSRGGDGRRRPVRLPAALPASHRLRVHRRGALRQPLVTQLQTLLPQTLQGEDKLENLLRTNQKIIRLDPPGQAGRGDHPGADCHGARVRDEVSGQPPRGQHGGRHQGAAAAW